jgi:predicted ester cyclase
VSLEENKALARRFYEGYNAGYLDTIFDLIAPDVVWHGPSDQPLTREQWQQIDATLLSAFPGLTLTIDDQIAEEDRVVTRTTLQGIHQGEFQGLAPTGKPVTMRVINIDRIAYGQVIEHWVATYSPGLRQQLTASAM